MNKETLNKGVGKFKDTTREALQTFHDALPKGQQNKILKNEAVKALCDLYGVEYQKEDQQ